MILYSSSVVGFKKDMDNNSTSEHFMESIVRNSNIVDDCGALIEFNIPNTNKRVDFLVTEKSEDDTDNFVVVEPM